MILEHALLSVRTGGEETFESDVRQALVIITSAPDCHGAEIRRQVEEPSTFLLLVRWSSLEAHFAFRETDLFTQWRALTWPHYESPPSVTHFDEPLAYVG